MVFDSVEEEKPDDDQSFFDDRNELQEANMVPGYYMSKRGISLPKLDQKDISLDVTIENSVSMTAQKKSPSKFSPRKNVPLTDLGMIDLK